MYDKQGARLSDGINLDRLLVELHAKRKWLDDVIGGLEAVEHSPEVALVTAVEEILGSAWSPKPKVDLLGDRTRRLKPLLSQVRHPKESAQRLEETQTDLPA
jgi:hypothetical protein